MQEGRSISLDNSDLQVTGAAFPDHIIATGATVSQESVTLSFGKEYLSIGIDGVFPNYPELEAIKVKEGRFINRRDMTEKRKVMVIHEKTANSLFADKSPVGEYINATGVAYQIVGIYTDQNSFSPTALVPFTTLQAVYAKGRQHRQHYFLRPRRSPMRRTTTHSKQTIAALSETRNSLTRPTTAPSGYGTGSRNTCSSKRPPESCIQPFG